MFEELKAELERLDAQIEQSKAQLNQLMGARQAFQFVIDKYSGEAAPDEDTPETIDLEANGLHVEPEV